MTRLVLQGEEIPLPEPSPLTAPFWKGCANGVLLFQRCKACGQAVFNPSMACRQCGRDELVWEESKGRGEVYSWSVVWRPQTRAFQVPYAPVLVTIDEGYEMLSNLVDCDSDDIAVGMRVAVTFREVGGMTLPYFARTITEPQMDAPNSGEVQRRSP